MHTVIMYFTECFTIYCRRNYISNPQRHKGKGKGKVHPRTGHEGPEGE
jgi:hypothetical protein